MTDELYHRAILDLARQAGGTPRLEAPDASVTVDNPLCGDRVTLDLTLADGRVGAIGHKVRGCLLCQAAAAVIAARAPGETPAVLREVAGRLTEAIRKGSAARRRPLARARGVRPGRTGTRAGTTACSCRSRPSPRRSPRPKPAPAELSPPAEPGRCRRRSGWRGASP